MKRDVPRRLLAGAMTIALAACMDSAPPHDRGEGQAVQDAAGDSSAIEWFDGTVEEAFAYARSEDKPVYLYWGAEWCPPCHAIKATVFRSAEFIARSKLFVSVYLDGDTENAQAAGEKFGVVGYPTMIVFDPAGNELTRIPGGIDIQAYAGVLDLTLEQTSPVSELVSGVTGRGDGISPNECRLLAYYSWEQHPELLEQHEQAALFRALYNACPAGQQPERSLLYMAYLAAVIGSADAKLTEAVLDEEQISEALAVVNTVLDDAALTRSNAVAINFAAADVTQLLTAAGSEERSRLIQRFSTALDRLQADESVYKRERIYTFLGRINLERIDDADAALSDRLRQQIEAMVSWADTSTSDPYERQVVINTVSNVLDAAGMHDVARPLLLAELKKSAQPYYFMVSLADLEQATGNHEKAIEWFSKAYDASKGPATRFQWGYYYLVGLIEMAPEDAAKIRDTTVSVVRELERGAGFYQRPKAQLERLEKKLLEWGKEPGRGGVVRDIRTGIMPVCDELKDQSDAVRICRSFLDTA